MALYRLEVKVVSRGKQGASMVAGAAYRSGSRLVEHGHGRSAVAASAHLAGDRLEDGRGGVVHDFRGKAVVRSEIMLPPGAPESFCDRETLWNAAEAAETRINSRVGREILAVLPRELGDAENLELVRDFVHERLVERGMCADFAIHAPTASDGLRQPHVHILCSVREVGPDGFGAKVRQWDKRELVTSLRQEWAADCNRSLELAGREERVSHLSLAAQLARRARARRLRPGGRGRSPPRRAPRAGRGRDGTRGHPHGHRRRAARDRGGERRACRRLRGGP